MKWELINQVGYHYVFACESASHELKVFATSLEGAILSAKFMLRDGVEIDVSGWEE